MADWCSRKEQLATMATALEAAETALAEERAKSRDLVQQNVAQGRDRDEWRARAEAAEVRLERQG